MALTDAKINELITCAKRITSSPKKFAARNSGNFQNSMELASIEQKYRFAVFMRQNIALPDRFSIGLMLIEEGTSDRTKLLRCNGKHGPHHNRIINNDVIDDQPHVHIATEAAINAGLDTDAFAVAISDYYSYQQCIAYFSTRVNIVDAEKLLVGNGGQVTMEYGESEDGSA